MRVVHHWKNHFLEKEVSGRIGFLLTDKSGGYLSFFDEPASRYCGWFVNLNGNLYKFIEGISCSEEPITELKNNFFNVERKRGSILERFFLPPYEHSLVYQTSKPANIKINFDFKESYDNQNYHREYDIFEENGLIFVHFLLKGKGVAYLAIKPNILFYARSDDNYYQNYPLDNERHSPPFGRRVRRALSFKCEKIVFSISHSKEEARKEALAVFQNSIKSEEKDKKRINQFYWLDKTREKPDLAMAYLCAQNSLSDCIVKGQHGMEIYAGFPWFFQFWTRDAALCLKSLFKVDFPKSKEIMLNLLENGLQPNGHSLKIISEKSVSQFDECADGAGWIFKRIGDLLGGYVWERFNGSEKNAIKRRLITTVIGLLKYHQKDELVFSGAQKTWMDTIKREGQRIEIQALALVIYDLAHKLTGDIYYFYLASNLKQKIKEKFWRSEFLFDAPDDLTIRPNIFLASYLYPNLLTTSDWSRCFEKALARLWLRWGGLATIDTRHPAFMPKSTGEVPLSYHNGDSWFYLNNLAALVMHRVNKEKFHAYFQKILATSAEEILWNGVVGHHSELSSANELRSEGCWAQAWSAAMFLEAMEEIYI